MSRLPDPRRSHALFVGADRFDSDSLDSLPAVSRNLSTLVDLFAGDLWGLDPSRCTRLLNPGSTREVDRAVHLAAEAATETLLVYYAGHGLLDLRGHLHLALPGSDTGAVHSTAFPYDWMRMRLGASGAARRIVILDCCFSARAMGVQSPASSIAALAEAEGTYVLAASDERAVALAPPGETYTAFTGALVSVLTEGIAGAPEFLDLDTIFQGVQSILRQQARPHPQCLGRNQVGRTSFTRNLAYVREQYVDFGSSLMNALHYLNTARSLADTLQAVAERAVADLGYELAAVNLVRQDGDLVVAAVSGSDAAESQIVGKAGPRAAWDHRLTMGDAWGNLRFVSHTEWETLEVDGVPEYLGPVRVEGEWHPQDRLYAPMYSSDGELLGVLSVHGTQTGRMPGLRQQQTLQTYAHQAAIAIGHARLRSNMQRALVRLEREQQALRASEASFRQAFEYAPSGAAIAEMSGDEAGRLIKANDALCRMLGRPASVMRRYALSDLLHPEDVPTWMRVSSEGGPVELRLSRRDGSYVWVSLRNSIVADSVEGRRFRLTHVEDIHERKLRELELTHHATHDQLTGLANSMGLHARLSDRLCGEPDSVDSLSSHRHAVSPEDRHTRGLAIVFCALRGFKSINANFGHEVGDAILVEISRRLHTWTRDTDTVARLGGDEFVLLVDSIDLAGVRDLVARTANELRDPLHLDSGQITRVNWSFGITWARCGATIAATIRAAREAAV